MSDDEAKLLDVIGQSDEEDLRSEDNASLSYRERLFEADGQTPSGPEVGLAVGTCSETGDGRAVCTVVLSMTGLGGFRRGQVIARGNLPVVDGRLASGTLTIVGGNAYDRRHGSTLVVDIWNPKKYRQAAP